jgi:hypothetical protein
MISRTESKSGVFVIVPLITIITIIGVSIFTQNTDGSKIIPIILSFIFGIIVLIGSLINPLVVVMLNSAFKKIIDGLWFLNFNIGGFTLSLQRFLAVILPILILYWLIVQREVKWGRKEDRTVQMGLLVYMLYTCFVFLNSPLMGSAIDDFFRICGGHLFFFAGYAYFKNDERIESYARLSALTCVFPFLTVIIQQTGIFQLADIGYRQQRELITGEILSNRQVGLYNDGPTIAVPMLVTIPLILYMLNSRYVTVKHRWFYMMVILMALYCTYFGFSRTMWLIVAVQFILWFMLTKPFSQTLLMIAVLLVIIATQMAFLQKFYVDTVDPFTVSFEDAATYERFGSGRGKLLGKVLPLFWQQNPIKIMFGLGLIGSHILTSNFVYDPEKLYGFSIEMEFFEYLMDFGVVGLIGFMIIMVAIVKTAIVKMNDKRLGENQQLLAKCWVIMLPVYIIPFASSHPTRWVFLTYIMWFFAGAVFRTRNDDVNTQILYNKKK